jgi:uncharacterized protein
MDVLALLFPREKKFYRMIEEQVALVGLAVDDFEDLVNRYDTLNPKQRAKYAPLISKKEKQDDILYTRMVGELKSTFITPMDREDIHQLVATFDTIIDTIELLTLKLSAYDIRKMDMYMKEQVKLLSLAYKHIQNTILSLRKESEVERICIAVRKIEQEADTVYMRALKNLFTNDTKVIDIIKLQDIYGSLERMIDQLNEAAVIIENLSVKYS